MLPPLHSYTYQAALWRSSTFPRGGSTQSCLVVPGSKQRCQVECGQKFKRIAVFQRLLCSPSDSDRLVYMPWLSPGQALLVTVVTLGLVLVYKVLVTVWALDNAR